jgi:hypothetical protein
MHPETRLRIDFTNGATDFAPRAGNIRAKEIYPGNVESNALGRPLRKMTQIP